MAALKAVTAASRHRGGEARLIYSDFAPSYADDLQARIAVCGWLLAPLNFTAARHGQIQA
jgi:hypothetical protein